MITLTQEERDEITTALEECLSSVTIFDKAVTEAEAVFGLRLIEPCNNLHQETKQLIWCIARLNGLTAVKRPVSEHSAMRSPVAPLPPESALNDRQGGDSSREISQ